MDLIKNFFNISSGNPSDEESEIDLMNKLMDIIINHAKEHYVKQFDPFILRQKQTFDVNDYVTIILNTYRISGATNFQKISYNTNVALKGEKRFSIGTDIELTDFKLDINFDAKLGIPGYRYHPTQKIACLTIKRCVFYFEFVVNVREKLIKVNNVRLISNDRIQCKTEGFIWPFSITVDTLIRKNIEQFISDNQPVIEDMIRRGANEFCSPYDFYAELKRNDEFMKIIKRFNF